MSTTPILWRSGFRDNATDNGIVQDSGVVAATIDDEFFAVWVDHGNFNGGSSTIVARKFDSFGNPVTGDVNLAGAIFGPTDQPAAVRLPIAGQASRLARSALKVAASI